MNAMGVGSLTLSQSPHGLPIAVPRPSGVVVAIRQSMNRVIESQCRANTSVSPYTCQTVHGQMIPASIQAVPKVLPGSP